MRLVLSSWGFIRRVGLTLGIASTLIMCLTACQPRYPSNPPYLIATPQATSTIPAGDGVVVGGIKPCYGIYDAAADRGFWAGEALVYRGTVSTVPDGSGITRNILPTDLVTKQKVSRDQRYRFVLRPGRYVLVGHYARPSDVFPWVEVEVTAGTVTGQNIPNECS